VRPDTIFRTTSFRLVAIYLGVFTLSVVLLGCVVYFNVGRQFETEFDERVSGETRSLLDYARVHTRDQLAQRIRFLAGQGGTLGYRLEDRAGALIAGSLPSLRGKDGRYADGWVESATPERDADSSSDVDWERSLVTTLADGDVLVVGQQLAAVNEARRAILIAFGWGLAATVVLGAAGGAVISAGFLRRLDAMSRAAERIMAGNLRHRIPEVADDDLGRLARTFNRMLERIERLIEANRHVSHDIAHDLRKPLARIVRRLEAARANNAEVAAYDQAVEAAIADVYGVLETFNALLRIAQIETGARRAGFKAVDLSAIAREVAEAFQLAADDEGKTLTIETDAALSLAGDEELLKQMVANVIDNALRHTPKGARIDVRSEHVNNVAALVIGDNGDGVPEAERQRIFERFYRLDAARTTPGDGLGLSLVAAIAELHGLKVAARDNRPGLSIAIEAPAA
jgi:signal transduction histidine kinase